MNKQNPGSRIVVTKGKGEREGGIVVKGVNRMVMDGHHYHTVNRMVSAPQCKEKYSVLHMNHGLLEASVAVVWSLSSVQLFANPWTIQRSRLPCPSLSPGVCSYLCPLSW